MQNFSFNKLTLPLADEIFQLNNEFQLDQKPNKINGGIGVYLDNYGQPFVLPVVKKAISQIDFSNLNYLPISGDPIFLEESSKLVLGENLYFKNIEKIAKQGVMGGTNGLFVWGNLIKQNNKKPSIILSNPTWENHQRIFSYLGFKIINYSHLDNKGNFNASAFKKTIIQHPQSSILLHGGSTHNPTGVNPTQAQWKEISKLLIKRGNHVCFDFAYLGLGENIEKDCFPVRLFIQSNIPTSVVISYSKNMTLYQHRTGLLLTLAQSLSEKKIIESNLKNIFRIVNSNPSALGELIVKKIFENKNLKKEWEISILEMVKSLNKRRELFAEKTNGKFSSVTSQKGLYSLLGINKNQVVKLKKEYGIYILSNSRINFGGISIKDISILAKAILETTA